MKLHPKPFFTKKQKVDAKNLKPCIKFLLLYSLKKKLCLIRSLSKKLVKKAKIMSQVGVQKLGMPVFFTAVGVYGLLK